MNANINTGGVVNLKQNFKEYAVKYVKSNECNDEICLMVYDNVKYTECGRQVKITTIIENIRSNEERKDIKKEELPVGYFSVGGFDGRKCNANVSAHTGLIIFDIDKKDNLDLDFDNLKEKLMINKYIYAYFTSPNGGLKIVVNANITDKGHHNAYYTSIKNYLLNKFNQINKIDTTGNNIARSCFLPYDKNAYFNPNAFKFRLKEEEIQELSSMLVNNSAFTDSSKSLLPSFSLSFDEHYDNILNLLKKRTSVGLLNNIDNENRTSVPLLDDNDNDYLKKRTSVGLYDNIFNKYRYKNIEGIMSTNVPFLELLIWQYYNPAKFVNDKDGKEINMNNGLDYQTHIDEYYFKDDQQKIISIDSLDGLDGLDVCEIVLTKNTKIKEHYRARTLGSITMKLIFNNPFCHPDYILREVQRINDYLCEDPNPKKNPKPDESEVRNIVIYNYNRFLEGTLDFSSVIRKKNNKKDEVSKKYVFRSRLYKNDNKKEIQLDAIKAFHDGRQTKIMKKYNEAITALQDGKKITQERIAKYVGKSTRQLRRYDTKKYDELIDNYNKTIKKK